MAAHHSNHKRMYGYSAHRDSNLDAVSGLVDAAIAQPWWRAFEVQAFSKAVCSSNNCSCHGCLMTPEDIEYFNQGARGGFQYIAQRHGLNPVEMWAIVERGMKKLGIHHDDLENLQHYCFGWLDLTPEAMHRWAIRYPKRCPLLDVLCSLDHTCNDLNDVQDWLLDKKNSYGRTRNDVLPVLPDPDGVRPSGTPTTTFTPI